MRLDERDLKRLDVWAREHRSTRAQAIGAAVRALTCSPDWDPLLDLSGDINGLPRNLSQCFDDYLDQTFVAKLSVSSRSITHSTRPG